MTTDNRRLASRLLTCVPVGVQTAEKERVGLIRDASTVGALVFSKSKFNVDDKVTLNIRVDEDATTEFDVKGRVLRVERLDHGFWAYKMGVVFEPPREDLAPIFKELSDRQERLFGSGSTPPKEG